MTEKRSHWKHLNMFFLWIIASLGITHADRELFSCDFERPCILNQERSNDDFDWTLHNGVTDQWFTGPSSDHTIGDDEGHYYYAQSDIDSFGTSAQLFSPLFNLTKKMVRLEFYYHMYDARYPDNMGTLNVYAQPCGTEQLVFSRAGNQGYLWKKAEIELHCDTKVQIAIEAVRGGTESDIAIDDIQLIDVFDNSLTGTEIAITDEPVTMITDALTQSNPETVRPVPIGGDIGPATDPIRWPVGTQAPIVPTSTPTTTKITQENTQENTATSKTGTGTNQTPKSTPKLIAENRGTDDDSSIPTTTGSTAIWGPPSRTQGESTVIIGAAVGVGILCVLILILIVLVWKTRGRKNDDQGRGEMYENQAFNRSQDLHQLHADPSYTALQFSRGRSTASTVAAPSPPKRRHTPAGKYIGLRKPRNYKDRSLSGHSSGISTISTTRSSNSNEFHDFGSTMEGTIGVYEAVPTVRRPRRVVSESMGNPVYIGGNESELEIHSSAKLPAGRPHVGPLEPKYYTVLPDVVDSLHYKIRVNSVNKAQTVPSHARTWHINDHYPVSDDSAVSSKDSVYADVDDSRSSLSDYSTGDVDGVGDNIYGPYEIEC